MTGLKISFSSLVPPSELGDVFSAVGTEAEGAAEVEAEAAAEGAVVLGTASLGIDSRGEGRGDEEGDDGLGVRIAAATATLKRR